MEFVVFLSWLTEYHLTSNIQIMILNLIQLGPALENIPINIQCKTIASMYNEIYK